MTPVAGDKRLARGEQGETVDSLLDRVLVDPRCGDGDGQAGGRTRDGRAASNELGGDEGLAADELEGPAQDLVPVGTLIQ